MLSTLRARLAAGAAHEATAGDAVMTRAEAKRQVCEGAATILDNATENSWLWEGLSESDARRMQEAFDELVTELRRRAGGQLKASG